MSAFVARRGVRRREVDEHARFVPDHPGVVAGWDDGVGVRAYAATRFPSGALAPAGTPDTTPPHVSNATTRHPAQIPQEVAGGSRLRPLVPARPQPKGLLVREIPAYSRSAPRQQDRPVTPEVAGSSPVAPVNSLQISYLLLPRQAQTTAGFFTSRRHPAPEIAGQTRLEQRIPAGRTTGHTAGRPPRAISMHRAFAGCSSVGLWPPASVPRGHIAWNALARREARSST